MPHDTLSTLATLAGSRLKERGFMLATAESCTGGWVAQAVTAIAGSSEWFDCGFVTYSNSAKEDLLGVPRVTLRQHGAVSEETAAAMVLGALERSRAQVGVAVTGIAGPGGGSAERPVGTVCFAWGRRDGPVRTARILFQGDRHEVREQTILAALQGVLDLVGL